MASLLVFRRLRLSAGAVKGMWTKVEGDASVNCWTWRGTDSSRRRVSMSSLTLSSSSSSSKYHHRYRNGISGGVNHCWDDKRIKPDLNYGGGSHQLTAGFETSAVDLSQETDLEKEALKREKVLRVKLRSRRVDAVLKAGLSMSRNKIEKALYEDRIRVNGVRPKKKSQTVDEGDEVDIVRGYNKLNPDFLDVSRVEVEELGEEEEEDSDDSGSEDDEASSKIPAVLRRSKLLTIKNYSPPWKGKSDDY